MTPQDEVIMHIDALIKLSGLDESESATMIFVDLLDEAVIKARDAMVRSHEQGLCLDCRWIIAETLLRESHRIQATA